MLGLRSCMLAFSHSSEQGLLSSCSAWASHGCGFSCFRAQPPRLPSFSRCGSQALEHKLNSCGARALLLHGMWDLLGPGIELVSPALAGGFFTTESLVKPIIFFLRRFVEGINEGLPPPQDLLDVTETSTNLS